MVGRSRCWAGGGGGGGVWSWVGGRGTGTGMGSYPASLTRLHRTNRQDISRFWELGALLEHFKPINGAHHDATGPSTGRSRTPGSSALCCQLPGMSGVRNIRSPWLLMGDWFRAPSVLALVSRVVGSCSIPQQQQTGPFIPRLLSRIDDPRPPPSISFLTWVLARAHVPGGARLPSTDVHPVLAF